MKICSKCKVEKSYGDFYENKDYSFSYQCIECMRQYRKENAEIIKKYREQYVRGIQELQQ